MAEWIGGHAVIEGNVVARADDVPDLVGEGIGQRRALMMDDGEGAIGGRRNRRGKSTTVRVVHDQQ